MRFCYRGDPNNPILVLVIDEDGQLLDRGVKIGIRLPEGAEQAIEYMLTHAGKAG